MASVDDAKRAWARSYDGLGQEEVDQRILGFAALVHGIAGHGAVPPSLSIRETDELAQAHWVERTRAAARRAAHQPTER